MTWVLVLVIGIIVLGGAWFYMQQQAATPAPADHSTSLGIESSVSQGTIDGLGSGAAPSEPQN